MDGRTQGHQNTSQSITLPLSACIYPQCILMPCVPQFGYVARARPTMKTTSDRVWSKKQVLPWVQVICCSETRPVFLPPRCSMRGNVLFGAWFKFSLQVASIVNLKVIWLLLLELSSNVWLWLIPHVGTGQLNQIRWAFLQRTFLLMLLMHKLSSLTSFWIVD